MLHLQMKTRPEWIAAVLNDFDPFLLDHASCERKASALAMSLVAHYPNRPELIDAMIELALEELVHFQQVYQHIFSKKLVMVPDTKDLYVGALRKQMRKGSDLYFLDRLLVAAIIEARGCERFGLIAEALAEGPLKTFYQDITRSEARHHGLFVRLARLYFPEDAVQPRLQELLKEESSIVANLPIRSAVH